MKDAEERNITNEETEILSKNLSELTAEELEQISGGLGIDKFHVIKRKIDKLYADGRIESKERSEIILMALQKNEQSYISFAIKYASVHGLSVDDIMF